MEKVLVTGATGFLGSHLVEFLIKSGYSVRALVRKTSVSKLSNVANLELALGDIREPDALSRALDGVDYVIHCAGLVKAYHPQQFYHVNAQGTENLLEAVVKSTHQIKRFVHISSLAAMGPNVGQQASMPIEAARPVSNYGKSKLEAEKRIQRFINQLPITIVRPPAIYGPSDRECLILFKLVSWRIWPSFLSQNKKLSVIYVEDAVNAIMHAMKNDKNSGNSYFIDDGHAYLIHDLIGVLKDALNVRRLFNVPIPTKALKFGLGIVDKYAAFLKKPTMLGKDKLQELVQEDWSCNSQLANTQLRWAANTDWNTGAIKTLNWYKQQGWI